MPNMMNAPRGRAVRSEGFVDTIHWDNNKNHSSQTGFVLFVCRAPIIWYSKKRQMVESSVLLSEFISMKLCTLVIKAL